MQGRQAQPHVTAPGVDVVDFNPLVVTHRVGEAAAKTPSHRVPAGACHCTRSSFDPLNQYEGRSNSEATFEEEYARANKDLDEEPANLQQRKTWLSLIFLVLIVGPAIATFFITAKDWADPLVRVVPPGDSKQVQDIFFGGNAWLVSCVTSKTAAAKAPSVLQAAAELLRPRGVRVARVHCWEPLETKKGLRSLAQRFGFRDKPPVVMATRGQGSPTLLAATGLRAEALAAKVLAAVIPEESATLKAYTVREGSPLVRKKGRAGCRGAYSRIATLCAPSLREIKSIAARGSADAEACHQNVCQSVAKTRYSHKGTQWGIVEHKGEGA